MISYQTQASFILCDKLLSIAIWNIHTTNNTFCIHQTRVNISTSNQNYPSLICIIYSPKYSKASGSAFLVKQKRVSHGQCGSIKVRIYLHNEMTKTVVSFDCFH